MTLVAIYPVFFAQSSLAQVDLPAAGFTFWALAAYLEDRPWWTAIWFSLAGLTKETAVIAPAALVVWQIAGAAMRGRWSEFAVPRERRTRTWHLLLAVAPLACWFVYHRAKTGFFLGNPDFFRYNVAGTLNPLRMPLALAMRLWQVLGYLGLYLLTLAGVLAISRPVRAQSGAARVRIPLWQQAALGAVVLAYLSFMSAVGGAVLARYLLPAMPLVVLLWVATLWRQVRYWALMAAAVAIAFVAGLFTNPPYGFSLEDNLAYRDYVVMHAEAARFLAMTAPDARVLTAWPASDELSRPWLGYVARPFPVVRIEDFTAAQVALAARVSNRFDAALVFSTKYEPPQALFEDWAAWNRIKERFFGYHRDLPPEEIAQRLGGSILFEKRVSGQWVAVIAFDRPQHAWLNGAGPIR
jgi:hypothetical protein